MRRKLLIALAALPLAVASVAATDGDSSSEAEALNVNDQIVVSSTSATTEGDGSANATAIELGGETVSGGSQEGEGSSSGELGGTGETQLGSVSVAPWRAEVDGEGNAESEAHAARVTVIDEDTAYVEVLSARSTATHEGSESESAGATIDLGDGQFHAILLHAYSNSKGEGGAALADINGNEIGSDEHFDGGCELPADPLLRLVCVYADETGEGAIGADNDGTAGVIDVAALDDNIKGDGFQSSATETPAGDTEVLAGAPNEPAEDDGEGAPNDVTTASAPTGRDALPLTGGGIGLALMGLAAMLGGEGLRRFRG